MRSVLSRTVPFRPVPSRLQRCFSNSVSLSQAPHSPFIFELGTVECNPRVDNRDFFSAFPFLFVFLSRCRTSHELQTRCFLAGKTTEPVEFSSVLQFDSNNFFTQKS
ncbi:hypothetical protein DVH24_017969 [Malus domestica]|uniref:Uncharacterized protein n=1 Tax=Malus domestica TaxID=3750 RepID=A0A498KEX6_MALDO|nr:hypothetical protein DVH24_017969 [Malus domestica]